MAERPATLVRTDDHYVVVTWLGIQENGGVFDTGAAVSVGPADGVTIQGAGNFDTSFTVQLHGSNDGTNFFQMTDRAGADIILTASALYFDVPDKPRFMKLQGAVAGAADASDVNVFMAGTERR